LNGFEIHFLNTFYNLPVIIALFWRQLGMAVKASVFCWFGFA
jgi:hypothetical protein